MVLHGWTAKERSICVFLPACLDVEQKKNEEMLEHCQQTLKMQLYSLLNAPSPQVQNTLCTSVPFPSVFCFLCVSQGSLRNSKTVPITLSDLVMLVPIIM